VVGYAVIWYVTLKTGSGWQYALLFIASQLALAITTIPGGVWADRYSRKALMIGADLFVALWTVVLAFVLLSGYDKLWIIASVLCLRGLAGGIQTPAVSAAIPQLVPPDKLLRVNSISATLTGLTYIAGPAVGALLLVYIPLGYILFVDAFTALIGIGCVALITIPKIKNAIAAPEGLKGYVTHMMEAGRYAMAIPPLRRLAILMLFMFVIVLAPANMSPVMVVRFFGPEEWMLAAVEMGWSIGMIVGGGILAVWGGPKNRMTLALVTTALWGVCSIGLGLSPNIWVFLAVMILFGITVPGFNIAGMTSVQELIPENLLGRTMGIINFMLAMAVPIGMLIFGPLADIVDLRILCVVCGIIGVIFVGITALDRGPASQLYAPEPNPQDPAKP
jgi:DHA3 family macrolide efflux protein-like MFS transporter